MRCVSILNIAIVLDEYGETSVRSHWKISWKKLSVKFMTNMTRMKKISVHKISDKEYLVEGSVNLTTSNDCLELNLESEEYDSRWIYHRASGPASGTR